MSTRILGLLRWVALALTVALPPAVQADELAIELDQLSKILESQRDQVVFIDVRDPVEIMFTGFTDAVDRNVPYLLVDRNDWDAEKNRFRLNRNADFAAQVEQILKAKGLDKRAIVVTMCRSGSERGKPSAAYLREQGFEQALYLVHGFQGSSLKEGEHKGLRIENGWQNSGLPWQSKPNPEKIYRP